MEKNCSHKFDVGNRNLRSIYIPLAFLFFLLRFKAHSVNESAVLVEFRVESSCLIFKHSATSVSSSLISLIFPSNISELLFQIRDCV